MKKIFSISIVLMITMFYLSLFCYAEETVQVQLPEFDVQLNDQVIKNDYRMYPIFRYNDITYFPMTWFDCRYLNVETNWKPDLGLFVETSNVISTYRPDLLTKRNSSCLYAHKINFDVYVNGHLYDNALYPFLSYNNVTYLPLTSELVSESLGWTYEWDDKKGLHITSNRPTMTAVELPEYASLNDIYYFEGNYYFVQTMDEENHVMCLNENDPKNIEDMYTYNYDATTKTAFFEKQNELWFSYHTGGGVMGSNHYVQITGNDQVKEQLSGKLDFLPYKNAYIEIRYSVPPSADNLYLLNDNKANIGSTGVLYGWNVEAYTSKGMNMGEGNSEYVADDKLYIYGSDIISSETKLNRLHRIDLIDKSESVIIDENIVKIEYSNDYIYYENKADGYIYRCDYDGNNIALIYDRVVEEGQTWDVFNDQILLATSTNDFEKNDIDLVLSSKTVEFKGVKNYFLDNEYLILRYADEDYGIIIIYKTGETLLRITDQVENIYNTDSCILFENDLGKIIRIDHTLF